MDWGETERKGVWWLKGDTEDVRVKRGAQKGLMEGRDGEKNVWKRGCRGVPGREKKKRIWEMGM